MKLTGDNAAKIRYWATHPKVVALPAPSNIPRITSRKFRSYEEMNRWKQELLQEIARNGGLKWTN